MGIFSRKEKRELTQQQQLDVLVGASVTDKPVTKDEALHIPAVSACVSIIADTIAMLPIRLYQVTDNKVTTIRDDKRVALLNDDTKDTLDGYQFKVAMITDYLLGGASYAYINRKRNEIDSLHYVDKSSVTITKGIDPIFKSYDIMVQGQPYRDFDFIKMTRRSKDGVTGRGIIDENNKVLTVAYHTLVYENVLVLTGGNKKGFLKAKNKLSQIAIDALKAAWRKLYSNNEENVVVLNDGIEFQEASNTSVEMQLNENKKTNAEFICKMFLVPPSILDGTASDAVYNNWIKVCILPILIAFQTALNKDLLLENEKGSFCFAFDTKELLKGDIEKRFKAYEIAVNSNIMQVDEVRFLENLEPIGFNFVKLGLQDVLYNIETKEIYTPNTNKTANMDGLETVEGGDENENRDPKQPGND